MNDLRRRIESKVERITESGCWIWIGASSEHHKSRRGQIRINRKCYLAHRVSYMIFKGSIPEGKEVCHTCDIPECVNPDHLFLGTHLQNMQDCKMKGRNSHQGREKLEKCCRGNLFTDSTIYLYKGKRHCRIFVNIRKAEYRKRRRED